MFSYNILELSLDYIAKQLLWKLSYFHEPNIVHLS